MKTASYLHEQELLALEEMMGTVSTAVPENVLDRCLERSIYQGIAECREEENDVKCSICQVSILDLFLHFPFYLSIDL